MATTDHTPQPDGAPERRVMRPSWSRAASAVRFTAGMGILSVVFVVSQGLVRAHELTQQSPATRVQ